MVQGTLIKQEKDENILNEGFKTDPQNLNNSNEFENAKYLYNSFEQKYDALTKNINLNDFNEIEKMNMLTSLIEKLRVAFTIYEASHYENVASNNSLKEDEVEKMNNFYLIYNNCIEVYNSQRKTL